jgi:chromosome transmission fidelity protein 18
MNYNDMVVENETKFLNACRNESKSKYLYDRPVTMDSFDTDNAAQGGSSNYTIVLPDGNRYFLKPRNKSTTAITDTRVTSSGSLLTKSMDEIAREADAIKVNILAKKALSDSKVHNTDTDKYQSMMDGDDYRLDDDLDDIVQKNKLVESGLWVDKYAPKSFAQLLSPEKINREVLRALKLWDPYVFREKSTTAGSNSATHGDGNSRSNNEMDIDVMVNDEVGDNDDDDNEDKFVPISKDKAGAVAAKDIRPQYRIILLCGPPGTGKTTLAHCVAKQCGYRPFEVNASDDRSAAILKDTMARAMHGNTIVGDRRPNCIILDEIDGIDGKQSIDALLAIVKAPLNSKANKGKRRSESLALTRPLICICNDEYSPALRELKNLSIRFRFTPPSEARLVQRLKAVCSIEGLNTNTNSLTTLCSATGNDIRASINTLQFASMRARELISKKENAKSTMAIGEVLSSMICSGLKDEHKDILQVWREVFSRKEIQAIIHQKKQRLLGQYGQDHIVNTSTAGKGVRILDPCMEVIQSTIDHGDLALVLSGIHENIYKIPFSDPNMSRLQRALDWLSLSDNLNTFTMTNPDGFQVLGYVAPTAGAIHCLCAIDTNVKVDWPKIDKINYHKTQQKLSILNSLRESKGTSVLSNRTLIALDSVSYILDLVNPKFKQSFNVSHSLSKVERQQLHDIVQIMYACGLSYNASKVIDGSSVTSSFHQHASLQLEPPISELVKYCATENIVCDELASRRVYLHQEIRNMVRADLRKYVISVKGDAAGDAMDTTLTSPSKSSPSNKRKAPVSAAKDVTNQMLAELDESNEKRLRISRMDFFCKPKDSKGADSAAKDVRSENTAHVNKSKSGVHFKYNQGFSNAVRRPVSISEFI